MIEVALTGHDDFTFEFPCRICQQPFTHLALAYYAFERPTVGKRRTQGLWVHRACLNDRRLRELFGTAAVTLMAATRVFRQILTTCPPPTEEHRPMPYESALSWARRNGPVKVQRNTS